MRSSSTMSPRFSFVTHFSQECQHRRIAQNGRLCEIAMHMPLSSSSSRAKRIPGQVMPNFCTDRARNCRVSTTDSGLEYSCLSARLWCFWWPLHAVSDTRLRVFDDRSAFFSRKDVRRISIRSPASSAIGAARAIMTLTCSNIQCNIRSLRWIPSNLQVNYHS